ncbi:WYL domain-containing protein [Georgenia sp. MJ206]|uniref:helix-turn-helix transcriptional regulator n=1 Tax=Georgenia wangjunii TaxID=3117730 RepID=UPI002F26131F
MASRVEPAERLLDLLIALTHAQGRMTKAQVRRGVNGYRDATSDESFERMFERDKDLLREMGVPVVTETDPVHEDDVGYRIDTAGYSLPPVSFTPAEVGVLSLAAEVWQDAHLHGSARRGLTKLRAVGPAPEPDAHAGLALRVRGPEPAFDPILAAIADRREVTFTYRAASTGQVARRRVQPWRLVSRDRGWYVLGHDVDRDAPRAFRLSRVMGRVAHAGPPGAFTVPPHDPAALLGREHAAGTAELAVTPERASALRARAVGAPGERAGRDVLTVPIQDEEALAEEIATYADAVLVLSPASLRDAVLRRLRAAAGLADAGLTDAAAGDPEPADAARAAGEGTP